MGDFPDRYLSTIEKAYQIIISRIDGLKVTDLSYRALQLSLVDKGIGGFIIFGGTRDDIREFISEAQSRARIPLFISSDIERGVGQQIEGMTLFPCQMAVAAAINRADKDDLDLVQDALRAVASEAGELGINMAFSPVLDVNRDPDNPIICTRAYSDDPETVSWFGDQYIKAFEAAGIISCAKHFPGHGDTSADSHIELPVIRKSMDELYALDLVPFREAVRAGVGGIMIGHLSVPALDTRPASLSAKVIKGLLRQEMGFTGLVLTDALNMHALEEFGEAGLESLKAGADILLHPDNADSTATSIFTAIEEGRLGPQTLDSAVNRTIDKKRALPDTMQSRINIERHTLLSERMSRNSITLLKDSPKILPLTDGDIRLILSGDDKYFGPSILTGKFASMDGDNPETSADKIIVIAVFTSVAAWRGSSGIADIEKTRLRSIIKKARGSVVVSFGSPYVLRHFSDADALIAAYDPTIQAQQAVFDCLTGKAPFRGGLPVYIPER